MTQLGYIKPGVGRPCGDCAARGRLTFLSDDGTCRRCAPQPVHTPSAWNCQEPYDGMTYAQRICAACKEESAR